MTYCFVLCNLFMHLRSGPGPAPPRRPGGPPHRAGGGPARPGPRPPNGRGVLPSWHRPSGDEGGRYLPSSDSEESGPVMRAGPRPGSKTGGRAAMRAHVSNSHHPVHSGRSPSSSFWQPFHVAIIQFDTFLILHSYNWLSDTVILTCCPLHPMDDLRQYDGRSGEERRRKIEVCVNVRYISEVYIFMIESGCFQPPCKRCIIRFFAMRPESGLLAKDSGV